MFALKVVNVKWLPFVRFLLGSAASLHTNKCSMEKPCTNDGACIKYEGFYKCVCPEEFSGDLCQAKQGNKC